MPVLGEVSTRVGDSRRRQPSVIFLLLLLLSVVPLMNWHERRRHMFPRIWIDIDLVNALLRGRIAGGILMLIQLHAMTRVLLVLWRRKREVRIHAGHIHDLFSGPKRMRRNCR